MPNLLDWRRQTVEAQKQRNVSSVPTCSVCGRPRGKDNATGKCFRCAPAEGNKRRRVPKYYRPREPKANQKMVICSGQTLEGTDYVCIRIEGSSKSQTRLVAVFGDQIDQLVQQLQKLRRGKHGH